MRGAGGTTGGTGRFFIGLVMLVAGGYLFLSNVQVLSHMRFGGFGYGAFSSYQVFLTSGYVFIPIIFGIGFLFYNARNPIGWVLLLGGLVMLIVGVIASVNLRMVRLSAFQLITILVLMMGGLGLFLSSLRKIS